MNKNILLLICTLLIQTLVNAQSKSTIMWLDVSVKAGFGNSYFYNYNLLQDSRISTYRFNPNYFVGGRLGTTLNNDLSVSCEVLYDFYSQAYHVTPLKEATYLKTVKISSLDIALMLRYTHFSGVYLEFGPKFCKFMDVKEEKTIPYAGNDNALNRFNSGMVKGVTFGMGFLIYSGMEDRIRITAGGRISYIYDDIMAQANYPATSDQTYDIRYQKEYGTYPLFFQVVGELTYYFGYYGRAGCGKSRLTVFSRTKRYF